MITNEVFLHVKENENAKEEVIVIEMVAGNPDQDHEVGIEVLETETGTEIGIGIGTGSEVVPEMIE